MEVFLSIKGLVSLGLNPRIESILIENRYHSLRKKLIDKGYVKNNVFVKDYVFNDKRGSLQEAIKSNESITYCTEAIVLLALTK